MMLKGDARMVCSILVSMVATGKRAMLWRIDVVVCMALSTAGIHSGGQESGYIRQKGVRAQVIDLHHQ